MIKKKRIEKNGGKFGDKLNIYLFNVPPLNNIIRIYVNKLVNKNQIKMTRQD